VEKRHILLYPTGAKHYGHYLQIAKHLSASNRVFIVSPNELVSLFESSLPKEVCVLKFENILNGDFGPSIQRKKIAIWGLLKQLRVISEAYFLAIWWATLHRSNLRREICKERKNFIKYFVKNKIQTVVVPCDRSFKLLPIIKASQQCGIPVFVSSHAQVIDNVNTLISTKRKKNVHSIKNVAQLIRDFPNQFINDSESHVVSFYYIEKLKALAKEQMLPNNPWCIGGGGSSYVFAYSKKMKESLSETGCSSEKILITGHPEDDVLYDSYCKKEYLNKIIQEKYGISNGVNVIIALPQLYEHGMLSWDDHLSEILFISEALAALPINVFISLHPRMECERYHFLGEQYEFHILSDPLSGILPIADIFIAASASSTISWAVLCNIPSIALNFDWFRYDDYAWAKSVSCAREKKQFLNLIKKMCINTEYIEKIKSDLVKDRELLLPFDGQAMERINEMLSQL
jgi:hypothetical protein